MRISIKNLDLRTSASTNCAAIWGQIYIEEKGVFFPELEWCDAVSSVLDMWLMEINEFLVSHQKRCILFFMDGPYEIQIVRKSKPELNIAFVRESNQEIINFQMSTELFLNDLLHNTFCFVEACQSASHQFMETRIFRRIVENAGKLHNFCKTGDVSLS